ncbi:hypothetical protein O181_113675 [Austropuccinia psidii MF-1]|uniref:Uncharacterized protein n=1 Tax=Austropuccinia psidii MF-1 TaxID=1389203 RepID=A0A9Q3K2Y7_9BASI|nr:hypothetical protein [Austropuccinia psidii MF-1]
MHKHSWLHQPKEWHKNTGQPPKTDDSDSDSMGDAIREPSDADQDQREEFLVEYQEETPLGIQDIQLEEGMPQDTANNNLCRHSWLHQPKEWHIYMGQPQK